jgi:hypothetical protein
VEKNNFFLKKIKGLTDNSNFIKSMSKIKDEVRNFILESQIREKVFFLRGGDLRFFFIFKTKNLIY